MTPSAYYVTLTTAEGFDTADYAHTANTLITALHATLGDPMVLRQVLHCPDLSSARVEVEVMQCEPASFSPVTARAIVRVESPKKLTFDKNTFSTLVRAELPFPVAISKRAVPKEELEAA